ncbi:hypothetical protein I2486_13770 [Cellulophaga sp. E16_2]|uniref:hypothetical protein n=1 Tax=Cellulophaga sp. E16_2 TaxID=2789297 RepID=UPI001A937BC5|nr:hypothetical protein [Cellulophaga sp. E16_2]MBO0592470.1 hypothetical protein [Cellulophaga sp. E16_2]
MDTKSEEIKKSIKNYLRLQHNDKLSTFILEGTIDRFLNKWSSIHFEETNNLENFKYANFESISEEELLAFNQDLSYQKIFDMIKIELN